MKLFKYLRDNFKIVIATYKMNFARHRKQRQLRREEKALNKAKKLADRRAAMDGRRYFVLPNWKGELMVLNRREVEALKKAGIMNKRVRAYDLFNEALYFTGTKPIIEP